ncbi:response regulator transcription factor [Dyella mobilis]|uniref:Response regulator transcription factor n=1 Tax=Dyella mobilis TaxID=1849582 RepID=A0ABS2KE56_9GAMM|nr:response regulator transcription factor [Dyella mobilis]MBM7129466.1 response regulator transcription factor [Dyella mobilis]GLQ98270.1 DNA-binding response regulator [Dyella mobilis]
MRILLIEDDPMVGKDLSESIKDSGFAVDWTQDGVAGQGALGAGTYAAVVLDLGLPRRSGLQVLQAMRAGGDATPVIVMTARDGEDERVEALDAGADDYVIKPCSVRELMARLRAVIRRRDGHAQSLIGTDALQLDLATREIVRRNERQSLSAREFAVLHALLERPGSILSREQLESRVYGWNEPVGSNAIEVVIHGLRKRFGASVILNVRGLGWRVPKDEA